MDPLHTLWAQDADAVDTTTADSPVVLARFLEEFCLHVDTEPFTCHASLPRIALGDTPLMGVCDEHHVVSIKKFPLYTSVEFMWKPSSTRMKNSRLRTKPWCTPTLTPDSSLCWPLTRTWFQAFDYMPRMTHTAHSLNLRLLKALNTTFLDTRSMAKSLTKVK